MSTAIKFSTTESPGDVLSPSSANRYRRCPAQWRYRHIGHLPDPPTGARSQGTAVHAAIAENFRQKIESKRDLPAVAVQSLYRKAWANALRGGTGRFARAELPTEFHPDEDPAQLKAQGEALTLKYLDEAAPYVAPVAVELGLTGRIGGATVRGFIDLLDASGRVIDVKTKSRRPSEDKVESDYRFQLATYRELCPQASGQAAVQTLVKTEAPQLVELAYTVQGCDLIETERIYPGGQQAIRTGLFLPNRSSHPPCAAASTAPSGGHVSGSSGAK